MAKKLSKLSLKCCACFAPQQLLYAAYKKVSNH